MSFAASRSPRRSLQLSGVGVSPGRVIAPVRTMADPPAEPSEARTHEDPATAEDRLRSAAADVAADLRARAAATSGDARAVLEATALMAADPTLMKSAVARLGEGASPERAMWDAATGVAAQFQAIGGYMAERATDILDVRSRVIARLLGVSAPGIPVSAEPFVLVARDLAPADTATLDPAQVLALVTIEGGPQSHTAILARALGIPAVVAAAGADGLVDDDSVFVDGAAGVVVSPPGPAEDDAVHAWQRARAAQAAFTGSATFSDGVAVSLLANVGDGTSARLAAELGAHGVGLFRTEFCFLDASEEPTIDAQRAAYREVFSAFSGRKVVVRTLDAGADKPLPFLTPAAEPNPALGVRGYRTTRLHPDVLVRQLSAVAAAAADTDAQVWVMAPMIATPDEAAEFARSAREQGLEVAGVMVEIPAAALSAAVIAADVDFLSIGTNDLTQYTLAADRQIAGLSDLASSWHPAVLRLIDATVTGARRITADTGRARPVGVCGEAAADPGLAVVLAGLGVDSLSMTPRALAPVAAVLASVSSDQAADLAQRALAARDAHAARTLVRAALPQLEALGL